MTERDSSPQPAGPSQHAGASEQHAPSGAAPVMRPGGTAPLFCDTAWLTASPAFRILGALHGKGPSYLLLVQGISRSH